MNSWNWASCGGFFGGRGMVLIGLFILIVVGVVVFMFLSRTRFGSPSAGHQSPTDILKARYARGEITRDEYRQGLEDLR